MTIPSIPGDGPFTDALCLLVAWSVLGYLALWLAVSLAWNALALFGWLLPRLPDGTPHE